MVIPGITSFLESFAKYRNRKIGILSHQAACTRNFEFSVKVILDAGLDVKYIFAPEHGFFSEEQDQRPVGNSHLFGIPVISLYGESLVPQEEILSSVDTIIIDLVDIGTRYYTYVWTSVLMLKQLSGKDMEVVVLDRPNPLGGEFIEGPILKEEYFSFVGLLPVPVVHGMTIAELIYFAVDYYGLDVNLEIFPVKGLKRSMLFYDTGLPFIPPSPNMPFLSSAFVYPGMCLLEATNLSEGRGTTRPFEIFGSPFINPFNLISELGRIDGAIIRPYYFIPTFNKYAGQKVGGGFIHVTSFSEFRPFEFGVKLLKTVINMYPDRFAFKNPPYEYEYEKMPIDILTGSDFIRKNINSLSVEEMSELWQKDVELFKNIREKYLFYA